MGRLEALGLSPNCKGAWTDTFRLLNAQGCEDVFYEGTGFEHAPDCDGYCEVALGRKSKMLVSPVRLLACAMKESRTLVVCDSGLGHRSSVDIMVTATITLFRNPESNTQCLAEALASLPHGRNQA